MYYLFVMLSITSCSLDFGYDYKIKRLPHKELSYEELPDSVRSFLYTESSSHMIIDEILFVDSIDSSIYHLESVEMGPWTDYYKLIDINKEITYRIEYSYYHPYIIWKNKLYIPYIPDRFEIYKSEHFKMAKYRAIATKAFSPPDRSSI